MFRFRLLTLILFLLLAAISLPAAGRERIYCTVCNKKISGQYVQDNAGNVYCSKKCLKKKLPHCVVCDQTMEEFIETADGRRFCSQKCFESQLPKCLNCGTPLQEHSVIKLPNGEFHFCNECVRQELCSNCMLPLDGRKLKDGRKICRSCEKKSVKNQEEAKKLFNQVRNNLRSWLGADNRHQIEFELVDADEIKTKFHDDIDREGVYQYSFTLIEKRTILGAVTTVRENEKCRIYILSHLPRDKFVTVAVHELAHDYMQHYIGEFPDQAAVKEGFAQFIAYVYNIKRKVPSENIQIEFTKDEVYGNGFRKMRDLAARLGGVPQLIAHLKAMAPRPPVGVKK